MVGFGQTYSNSYNNATGWTPNGPGYGTNYSIGPSTFNFNATPCAVYNYASIPLGFTLNNSSWCADIDFVYTSRPNFGVAHTLMSFTSNDTNSWNKTPGYAVSNNNVIEVYLTCNPNDTMGAEKIYANSKLGASWGTATAGINVSYPNTYYIRLQRLSPTQGMVTVFSNPGRTTVVGSQCFTIYSSVQNLAYLQQGCIPQGSSQRKLTGTLDNVTVSNVTPGITGLPPHAGVCSGTSSTLCVSSFCGGSYNWSVPTGSTINSGQGTTCINVTWGTTSGSVTCTTSFPSGGCTLVQSGTANINASPNVTATAGYNVYCISQAPSIVSFPLTASPTGSYTYSWSPGTYLNSTTIYNPTYTIPAGCPGQITYTVTVTDANGCTNSNTVSVRCDGTCRTANPNPNSESNPSADFLSISPNPSDGTLMLTFSAPNVAHDIEVLNLLGQVVYRQTGITDSSFPLNLSDQKKGVYFVKCWEGEELLVKQIVIQ